MRFIESASDGDIERMRSLQETGISLDITISVRITLYTSHSIDIYYKRIQCVQTIYGVIVKVAKQLYKIEEVSESR